MAATWIYQAGRLQAHEGGELLIAWEAPETLGRGLAEFLNQAPDLSRTLLVWSGRAPMAAPGPV